MTDTSRRMGMATDLFSNPRFVEFRAQLERHGATLRCLWSARTGRDPSGKGYDDIGLFQVVGSVSAAHGTVIVQDYGEDDGFGIWLESRTNDYDGTIAEIIDGLSPQPRAEAAQ